jgi:hypothetical protein
MVEGHIIVGTSLSPEEKEAQKAAAISVEGQLDAARKVYHEVKGRKDKVESQPYRTEPIPPKLLRELDLLKDRFEGLDRRLIGARKILKNGNFRVKKNKFTLRSLEGELDEFTPLHSEALTEISGLRVKRVEYLGLEDVLSRDHTTLMAAEERRLNPVIKKTYTKESTGSGLSKGGLIGGVKQFNSSIKVACRIVEYELLLKEELDEALTEKLNVANSKSRRQVTTLSKEEGIAKTLREVMGSSTDLIKGTVEYRMALNKVRSPKALRQQAERRAEEEKNEKALRGRIRVGDDMEE